MSAAETDRLHQAIQAAPDAGHEDVDTLARTLWAEARGEGAAGMEAVAAVILNRLGRPGWWSRNPGDGIADDTIAAVCRDPWQFSCWNAADPNRAKLLAVGPGDPAFAVAWDIAERACGGRLADPTGGADHYHVAGLTPHWAAGRRPCAIIGRHVFYRLA